jgi:endonuclease/exonuclease/phosphatase family metal-dependent hydrolase
MNGRIVIAALASLLPVALAAGTLQSGQSDVRGVESFADLTRSADCASRAFATINGARVAMAGKGSGSDGSKYPPENVFDDNLTTFTCAQKGPSPSAPLEINYDFGEAVKVNCYRLFAYSTAANGGYPKTWTFEGSNDGAAWKVLDERTDRKLTRNAWQTYRFAGEGAYRYYRLKITQGLSAKRFDLGEMEIGYEPGNHAAAKRARKTMNLATYNIHHGEAKGAKYDVKRSLAAVDWESQDYIGMNEVDWKSKRVGGADTPADIAAATGRHVEYAKAKPYGGGFYGNAVVSREKPISVERIDLPRGDGRNGLKCVLLLCEYPDLWFGSMHLDLRANLSNQLKSVEIVRGVVEEKSKTKPVFLCGDWNNEPDSEPLKKIGEFMTVVSDVYSQTYNGFTPLENAPTDERCIDFIAVDKAHTGRVAVVEQTVKYDFTSDHNPVFVTVEMSAE